MLAPKARGTITYIAPAGNYTVEVGNIDIILSSSNKKITMGRENLKYARYLEHPLLYLKLILRLFFARYQKFLWNFRIFEKFRSIF